MSIRELIPQGEVNRITTNEIKSLTGLSGSQLRRIINDARGKFVPIASDNKGYFIAEKPEELNHTIAQINSRIHKMIQAREGLKKAQRLMEEEENV